MSKDLQNYISAIQRLKPEDATEVTYRAPLQTLIESIKFDNLIIEIIQEGRSNALELEGTPDFFVYKDYNTIFKTLVGFIECKKISFNLETLIKSDQIQKYSKTSENIIITNYIEFILLQKGEQVARVNIFDKSLRAIQNTNLFEDFKNLLKSFYHYEYSYINNKQSITKVLASSSFYYSISLREYLKNPREEPFYKKFNALYKEMQNSLQISYKLEDFCDVYSQSLVYGLFIGRLETEDKFLDEKNVNYLSFIPNDYKLLKEFLKSGYDEDITPYSIKKSLVQIGKNLNFVNVGAIKQEFAKKNEGINSIAVYLYEDFLKEYDTLRATEKRKENGVYYTPKEVANFIVRSVDDILKTSFNKAKGIAEKGVKILDFACGTGTFLASVLDFLLEKDMEPLEKHAIKKKILSDIYGFELLFTPYIVAHTILVKRLKDEGIEIKSNERLAIYLTNTLDITSQHEITDHLPLLKDEYEKSYQVKNQAEILAIIGNPPYRSGKSNSLSPIIDNKITEDYKRGLNERNPRLDDLYIKFIKFAEWKVDNNKAGVVGIITNNSFLDGITHRKMREHLMNTFDEIYVLNLHGNARKGEGDKNIFDIMVGVSINIFIKYKTPLKEKKVRYFSTLENNLISRVEKLQFLEANDFENIKWQELKPIKPNFWFVKKDEMGIENYQEFINLKDIFQENSIGIKSSKDSFCIHYSKSSLEKLKQDVNNLDINQIKNKYNLKDTRDWKTDRAKQDLINFYNYTEIRYRIFDSRHTSLSKQNSGFLESSRYAVTRNFINQYNLGLVFSRYSEKSIFIVNKPIDIHFAGDNYLAPLYIYSEGGSLIEEDKKPNFKKDFDKFLKERYNKKPSPEEVLYYIYGVLHSPVYRRKYLEFLKTDFPKIPFAKSFETFQKYAGFGKTLTELHTLSNLPLEKDIKVNKVEEEFTIKNIHHSLNTLNIETNEKDIISFEGITKEIYDFEIGSYKPIEKWLKYRKADNVSLGASDLKHIKNMAISIKNTIKIMKELESLNEEFLN